jgi:fatty acid/phospholipid biosynthesis enzyme
MIDVQKAIQAITASARSEDEAKAALKQCGIMEELFGQIKMQDDQPSSDMIDISISKTVASESASQSLRPKRQRSLAAAAAAVKADSADAGSLNPSRRTAAAMMSGKKYLRITISRGLAFLGMNEVSEVSSDTPLLLNLLIACFKLPCFYFCDAN